MTDVKSGPSMPGQASSLSRKDAEATEAIYKAIYRGEKTPVTHLFSAIYSGYTWLYRIYLYLQLVGAHFVTITFTYRPGNWNIPN